MNLTQVSLFTKRAMVLLFALVFVYTLAYFSFPYAKSAYLTVFPKKQKPLPVFGKLEAIKFSGIPLSAGASPEYILNTRDGKLPAITPELINVYKIEKPSVSFSYGKNAQTNASILFFTKDNLASSLSGSNLKWIDTKLGRELNVNISLNTLDYKTNEAQVGNLLEEGPMLEFGKKESRESITSFLKKLGYFKDTLYEKGTEKITYGKTVDDKVVETVTPSEYKLGKIDFFRAIGKSAIVGPRIDNGLIEVTYAKPKEKESEALNFTRMKISEWAIDVLKPGKYPPVSVEVAWNAVKENKGVFARLKTKEDSAFGDEKTYNVSKVFIENIYLAYYDSNNFQKYLQPIYVFEGTFATQEGQTGKVAIYTPAIGGEFVQDSQTTP